MKYLDEFRTPSWPSGCSTEIHATTTRPWAMMEVCGGPDPLDHPARHRPAAARRDRDDPRARLPGLRDAAGDHRQGAGDRRPARRDLLLLRRHAAGARAASKDLFRVKSAGGDVRVVYSPLDALNDRPGEPRPSGGVLRHRLRDHRPAERDDRLPGQAAGHRELLAAGLATCWCRRRSRRSWSRRAAGCRRSWPPGHVCSVMGTAEYPPLAERYGVPIVVTGFEPLDILEGIRRTVLPARGRAGTRWRTPTRAPCRDEGNPAAHGDAARTSSRSPTGPGAASG